MRFSENYRILFIYSQFQFRFSAIAIRRSTVQIATFCPREGNIDYSRGI